MPQEGIVLGTIRKSGKPYNTLADETHMIDHNHKHE